MPNRRKVSANGVQKRGWENRKIWLHGRASVSSWKYIETYERKYMYIYHMLASLRLASTEERITRSSKQMKCS